MKLPLLPVLLVALTTGGCHLPLHSDARTAAMPVMTLPPVSTQLLAKSAQSWAKLADDIAAQVGKVPEFVGRPLYVPTPQEANKLLFLDTYASLLSSGLTRNGLSVTSSPQASLVVQVTTHLLPRAGGTALYAGDVPPEKAKVLQTKEGPAAIELVVVTDIREKNVVVYSHSDIVYVDPAEYRQYIDGVAQPTFRTRRASPSTSQ